MSQPLSRWELLVAKYAGLVTGISVATIAGFGLAGMFIATFAQSMDVSTYALLLVLVLALIAMMTGLGLVASVACTNRVQALGVAMLVWFLFVLFFDLVLVGTVSNIARGAGLLGAVLLNPVEIVRVLAIIQLEPDLQVLGPFGTYVLDTLGTANATTVLASALVAWIVLPVSAAVVLFAVRAD